MIRKRHSIRFKFLYIMLCGMLAALLLSLSYSLYISARHSALESAEKQKVVGAYARLLAEPVWNFDNDAIAAIQRALMTDSDMLRVEVLDEGLHPVADRHSPLWEEIADTRVIEQPILYRNAHIEQQAGLLRVTVGQTRLYNSIRQQIEEISILLFSLVLAVLICTWIIQTRVIGRPLNRLLETIITSRERPFQRLHWPIPDEFGRISAAFNRMQDNLEQQHRALAESELRFRSLYNRTPALLLILSRDGTIIDTSDHLLEFLGFNRDDLIGTPLAQLMTRESLQQHGDRVTRMLAETGELSNLPLQIRCARQQPIEVLLRATLQDDQQILAVMTDITRLKQAQQQIDHQANFDPLTGLPNRHRFRQTLEQLMARPDPALALLFLDLDHFKCVNDIFGHSTGDQLLIEASERIRESLRPQDMLARLGGDEFALILERVHQGDAAEEVARRVLSRLVRPFHLQDSEIFVSCSIGIALAPRDADTPEQLLQNADIAMYRAKEGGRNRYQLFLPEHQQAARHRLSMEQLLHHALDDDLLELHYQPIMRLEDRGLAGVEALLRLRHPERGLLPPAEFIALAEETGLIVQLGAWALHQAIEQFAAWQGQAGAPGFVSVNVSTRQFQSRQFLPSVRYALERHGIAGHCLTLEITESLLMHDNQNNLRIMQTLAELGCRIAIDDFGTGYSALSYLQKFPLSVLKIDRSFTRDCATTGPHRGLIEAIINMSRSLGLEVVTEGIETPDQLEYLCRHSELQGQGYYFSEPLSGDAFGSRFLGAPRRHSDTIQVAVFEEE